ncbi:MAG: LysR family transcriptional regulator [Kiloniellales bacterium]|nr:LysR family transcriptional regulator [Kiloniellales bacterium]
MISVKYDLNLLRIFDLLMAERNVTGAARRIGVTQSAVSGALSRLRDLFGDELFVRARYGVVPTEKALSLAPAVEQALQLLDQAVLETRDFDPARARRSFTIAASAYFECLLVPQLMARACREAPQVRLTVTPLAADLDPGDLASGRVDLALGRFTEPSENLVVSEVIDDGFVCLIRRRDSPDTTRLSKAGFTRMRHVVVSPPGVWRTGLFKLLDDKGLSREVALRVSHFLAAPLVVAQTGYCATLPRRIGLLFKADRRFRILEPPVNLGRFPMQIAWHPRRRRDRGHAWLRNLVREICAAL